MALRLSNTSPAPAAAAPAAAPHLALLDRARTALAVGNLHDYRAGAAGTAALDDPHRRYVTRRSLLTMGLEEALRPGRDASAVLLATARTGLEVLADAPAEPVLLQYTGVALMRLGAVAAGAPLIEAAARLDPAAPDLADNLAVVREARRKGLPSRPTGPLAPQLIEIERLARNLAERARPAASASITLCMIVRDEERSLARALRSAADVVDEVVVVDTGSTDRTVDIAHEHGARVLERPWADDFAAARNAGLDAATGDWILVLDADEELAADDAPKLRALARRTWREGYLLTIVNRVGESRASTALTHDVLRLFRNRPDHRFEGRIHEGVLHALPADAPERVELAGVRIDHDGYLADVRDAKDKSRRNLELLERQLRENPPTAYLLFNLGSEQLAAGLHAEAAWSFECAWQLLESQPDPAGVNFAPALASRTVTGLRAGGAPGEAIAAAERGLALFPDLTDLVLGKALALLDLGRLDEAESALRRCLELGDAPSRYTPVAGAGGALAATALGELLNLRGDPAQAAAVLGATLAENPDHDAARVPLADALLVLGRAEEAAAAAAAVPGESPFAEAAEARAALATAIGAPDGTGPLPGRAVAPLAAALDARLRAADIDGFVALLPLVDRVDGLGSRRAGELRAELYLTHGFLDSAADEWAAACEEHGPDAAALTGLSRVAAARGDAEDAALFAEGARELAAQSAA